MSDLYFRGWSLVMKIKFIMWKNYRFRFPRFNEEISRCYSESQVAFIVTALIHMHPKTWLNLRRRGKKKTENKYLAI